MWINGWLDRHQKKKSMWQNQDFLHVIGTMLTELVNEKMND
jgi:hypothetical protein